jgi:hypothetical protein
MQVFLNGNASGRAVNQIYNATSGTVSLSRAVNPFNTGSINDPGGTFGMVLLPTTRVILAVGWTGSVTTAAQYSIGSDSWALTDRLDPSGGFASEAYGSTLTVLDDGSALFTGGIALFNNNPNLAIVSSDRSLLYSPATGTFSNTTSALTIGRTFAASTLLQSGDVLLAGGSIDTAPDMAGSQQTTASAELYNHVRAPAFACLLFAQHGLLSFLGQKLRHTSCASAPALAIRASMLLLVTHMFCGVLVRHDKDVRCAACGVACA